MTGLIVADASVVTKWYLPEPMTNEALAWLRAAARQELTLTAPDLLLYEVGNVLWKHVRVRTLGPNDAESIRHSRNRSHGCAILHSAANLNPRPPAPNWINGITILSSPFLCKNGVPTRSFVPCRVELPVLGAARPPSILLLPSRWRPQFRSDSNR